MVELLIGRAKCGNLLYLFVVATETAFTLCSFHVLIRRRDIKVHEVAFVRNELFIVRLIRKLHRDQDFIASEGEILFSD